jgi:hypothetical protein
MGSCMDLRELQDSQAVADAYSKIVSGGRSGYKAVIERKKTVIKCDGCGTTLSGEEKFCPECGKKLKA